MILCDPIHGLDNAVDTAAALVTQDFRPPDHGLFGHPESLSGDGPRAVGTVAVLVDRATRVAVALLLVGTREYVECRHCTPTEFRVGGADACVKHIDVNSRTLIARARELAVEGKVLLIAPVQAPWDLTPHCVRLLFPQCDAVHLVCLHPLQAMCRVLAAEQLPQTVEAGSHHCLRSLGSSGGRPDVQH